MKSEQCEIKAFRRKTWNVNGFSEVDILSDELLKWRVAREDRDRDECKKVSNEIFDPQIGSFKLTSAFKSLGSIRGVPICGVPVDNKLLARIENLGAFLLIVKECNTLSAFLSAVFLYIKTEYTDSAVELVAVYLSKLLEVEAGFDSQTGEFEIKDSEEKPKWLSLLKDFQENWSLVVRNEGFKKISHLLSLCVVLGLCDYAKLNFQIAGMRMFSLGALPKHVTALDLLDAVFETITYFVEGGYTCFERKSLKPLLYGNMQNEEFEQSYAKCMLCSEYAKCGNLLRYENMTENDYELLLVKTIEKAQVLLMSCKGPVEKNIFNRKVDRLRQWQATFRQTRVQGGLREAPYSIGIYGGTSVGKSTIANVLMVTTLVGNGFDASDDRVITLNEDDKYMSNYRSHVNGVFIDDIGNTKPQFIERAPTKKIIEMVNNVKTYANMAEAEMKGKVSIEPKVVISTKNVKDTCAAVYSNEPASITRRDRITLTCKVKGEYSTHGMLDSDKIRAAFPSGTSMIPDFWYITVERSFPCTNSVKGRAATVGWEVLKHNGVLLEDITLPELIRFIKYDSDKFFRDQRELVSKSNNLAAQIPWCPKCNMPAPSCCICSLCDKSLEDDDSDSSDDDDDDNTAKDDDSSSSSSSSSSSDSDSDLDSNDDDSVQDQIGEFFTKTLFPDQGNNAHWTYDFTNKSVDIFLKRLNWLERSRWVVWTNWVPKSWLKNECLRRVIWLSYSRTLYQRIRDSYYNHILCMVFFTLLAIFVHYSFVILITFPLIGIAGVIEHEKQRLYDQIESDSEAMPSIFKMYRDRHVEWITNSCAIIAGLYAGVQLWKFFRTTFEPQGNLAPTTLGDILERDSEINPWAGVKVSKMPCTEKSKTTTTDRLEKMVQDNLCHMVITAEVDGKERNFNCDAFFPKSNVAIVPRHMWKNRDMKAKFTRHDPNLIGGNFESFLCREQSIDIPNTDLSLVWVPNGGDWKDLTDYLPLERFSSVPARLIYKRYDGSCIGSRLFMSVDMVTTKAAHFFGAKYNLEFKTFEGLCIAPLVTETKGPLIGGFHLGGKNGETRGCSGLLLKSEFDTAFEQLRNIPNVVLAKSSGKIPKELYDVQFFENTDVHPKSPINYLPEGTNCKYYGQVIGRASYYSDVEETVISKHVEDVCGVPQKWGGPKFHKGWPWQASLQYSTRPSCGIEGSLLDLAADDYLQGFLKALNKIPAMKLDVKPLTEMQTVCGIDGLRFIDKMPPSTSIGFPLSGPKSDYITLLDPKEHPTHQCPVVLDKRFWDHAYEMEELYLKGERAYPIFKACLKDEPTKKTKDKVRVFQGAPIALQLLVRKYYLPIARALSMLPLASECAVGINAQGPEWDQLAKYVMRFGKERILAGDYSKYDLRMPAQVMFVAFRVMMDIGVECGYSKRSLTIMEGVATDICYPLMAYNGDLIQHYGSNPSGQNLTVYINSIVNALLFRCAYYHITRGRMDVPKFRDVCSLITYGDDAKSSVHKDFPEFNHISVAKFLEERDMKFTMPDKESEPTPYMQDEDADLLKRANIYSEDTGMIMGALDEDSIFKSLHAVLKSKALTREQQAMQNIDGGLREWFSHGRDVYEERREQLKEIARRANIIHGCTVIHDSYDDRLKVWKEKYI